MAFQIVGGISRRSLIVGASGLAGAATVGTMAPFTALGQPAVPVRQDVLEFAKDANRLAKFEAAVKEMQDRSKRDPNDPKGWLVNANSHRDFCSLGGSDPKQIHFCYWFLSWHRAYIHITELKVREISGDKTLCYPYWNWSSDRRIPAAYAKTGSSLSNAQRIARSSGLSDENVDYNPNDPYLKKLGVAALSATVFEAKTGADISTSFGGIPRPNAQGNYGNNRIEGTPHGPVHNYVGGDMGDFATAGRDPIFFAHHGNLDRLWENWRQDLKRKSTEPKTNAFLKHNFVFPWLDGAPMQVSAESTLDTKKLGYVYDYLDALRPGTTPVLVAQAVENMLPPVATQKIAVPLASQSAGDNERKILEITGIQAPDKAMTVTVYLKPANTPANQVGTSVGSFAAIMAGGKVIWPTQTVSFDITAAANRYAGQELTVQLIPDRIQAQGAETYPPLKYDTMRIVTVK